MDLFVSHLKVRFPDLARETLQLSYDVFLYAYRKTNGKEPATSDAKEFFSQFDTDIKIVRWLLSTDPTILREIKSQQETNVEE